MTQNNAKNPIQTTKNSFVILQSLADLEGATLTELKDSVELSKGALYNHLATLQEIGVVVDRDGTYYVSPRIFQFGEASRQAFPGAEVARKRLWNLADATGEFTALVVPEDDTAIVIDIAAGQLVEKVWLSAGQEISLPTTAAGKVVLAQMSTERIRDLCSQADETIDEDRLIEEIRTIKAQGVAFSRGEVQKDRYSVAAPVVDSSNELVFVLTLIGDRERLGGKALQQDVAGLVLNAANEIQKTLYS